MSWRCPGASSSTSSTPPRWPTPCATSTASCIWRLLDGPGTWYDEPMRDFGATLHISDAGRARAAGWHPTA
jgi:hypothetical protein